MKVTVYTTSACQFSKQEKEYLQSKGVQFEEKNVEANKAYLDEMMQVGANFAGTPVTKIEKDDGTSSVLKGFTQSEFDSALGSAGPAIATANLDMKLGPTPSEPTPPPTTPQPSTPPVPVPPVSEPSPPVGGPTPTPPPTEPTSTPPTAPTSDTQPPAQTANNPLDAILADLQNKVADQPTSPTPPAPSTPPANPPVVEPPAVPSNPPVDMPTPPPPPAPAGTPVPDSPPAAPSELPNVPDFPAK